MLSVQSTFNNRVVFTTYKSNNQRLGAVDQRYWSDGLEKYLRIGLDYFLRKEQIGKCPTSNSFLVHRRLVVVAILENGLVLVLLLLLDLSEGLAHGVWDGLGHPSPSSGPVVPGMEALGALDEYGT